MKKILLLAAAMLAFTTIYAQDMQAEDTEAPKNLSADYDDVSYFSAVILSKAHDNSGTVIFKAFIGGKEVFSKTAVSDEDTKFTISGLDPNTEYNIEIQAHDEAGNVCEDTEEITITTEDAPSPAPAPTWDAKKVYSLYSDTYTQWTAWNIGSGQTTVVEEGKLAANDKALYCSNADFLVWVLQNGALDCSEVDSIHFDVWVKYGGGSIKFTPVWKDGEEEVEYLDSKDLEAGWNPISMALDDFMDIDKKTVCKLKWADMPTECFIDNVYFFGDNEVGNTPVPYVKADGTVDNCKAYSEVASASKQVTWKKGWYVVKDENVVLSQGATCSDTVNLILVDGAKLTATGKDIFGMAAIGGDNGSLINIYGQTEQTGQLIATSLEGSAAIGGSYNSGCGNIGIYGGTITATGGSGATAIGGGQDCIGSPKVYVSPSLLLKADNHNPPTTEIAANRTIVTDIANSLTGKLYATIKPIPGAKELSDDCDASTMTSTLQTLMESGKNYDITIKRTFYKDTCYNTICLPFSLSAQQLAISPLAGCKLKTFTSATVTNPNTSVMNIVLTLTDTTAIEAGIPYFISWPNGENIVNPVFKDVKVTKKVGEDVKKGEYIFKGYLTKHPMVANSQEEFFVNSNNDLSWPTKNADVKGFRGFIKILDD